MKRTNFQGNPAVVHFTASYANCIRLYMYNCTLYNVHISDIEFVVSQSILTHSLQDYMRSGMIASREKLKVIFLCLVSSILLCMMTMKLRTYAYNNSFEGKINFIHPVKRENISSSIISIEDRKFTNSLDPKTAKRNHLYNDYFDLIAGSKTNNVSPPTIISFLLSRLRIWQTSHLPNVSNITWKF